MPRGTKRSFSSRGAFSSKKMAHVPAHVKKYVQRAITNRTEKKIFLTGQLDVKVDNTSVGVGIHDLGKMTQGFASDNRIGDQVTLEKLDLGITMVSNDAGPTGVRVLILKATKEIGDAATDLFLYGGDGNGTAFTLDETRDLTYPINEETFQVVYDQVVMLTQVAATNNGYQKHLRIKRSLGYKQKFDANTSDGDKGNLRLLIVPRDPRNALSGTGAVLYNWTCALTFTDI